MKKHSAILLICLVASALAEAAPSAGDPCNKKDMGHPTVDKDGRMLGCMSTDVKWKVVEPKAGDFCATLNPDQAVKGAEGKSFICHNGKLVAK